jgi:serine kinase of HPr protein (carbohydrate metabolism regulator)
LVSVASVSAALPESDNDNVVFETIAEGNLCDCFVYEATLPSRTLGSAELSYLKSLSELDVRSRCRALCAQAIPSRSAKAPAALLEETEAAGIAVFRTPMITMRFTNAATLALEFALAGFFSYFALKRIQVLVVKGRALRWSAAPSRENCRRLGLQASALSARHHRNLLLSAENYGASRNGNPDR